MTRVLVLAGLMALLGGGCGDDGGSTQAGGNGTDRAFVAAMVPHHESAVEMARIARKRGESSFVRQLARDIVATQTREIAALRREDEALRTAGVEAGSLGMSEHMMGMGGDGAQLDSAEPFDRAFVTMMIPHHQGAIDMAKVELAKGGDPQLKALARDIVDAQRREIAAMRGHAGASDGEMQHGGHGAGHPG